MKLERRTIQGKSTHPAGRISVVVLLILVSAVPAAAQRTELEPGWNLFSPQDDVEMGRQVAREAEEQLAIIDDRELERYLERLGQQLAAQAPGEKYPYRFKLVNDKTVNAFALPGGFIYVHRGIVELASREAELAGVVAHEIGHVALRHGTNQASKAYITQAPLAILGSVFGGGGGVGSILTQLGIGFTANSIFLKFSRDAERQADLLGAQILFDAGYDPTGMSEFFEKMEAEHGNGAEFFSSHPNPGNRLENVGKEIQKLGDSPGRYRDNFSDFRRVKARLADIPEPDPRERRNRTRERTSRDRPDRPSGRYDRYQDRDLSFSYPDNWRVYEDRNSLTIAPDGGFISGQGGGLAYGVVVSTFDPRRDRRGRITLEEATDQLIEDLRMSNPGIRVGAGYRRGRLSGRGALSVVMIGDFPLGGYERDWIVTTFAPDGTFFYFIAVAPEPEFRTYERTFEAIFESIRFR